MAEKVECELCLRQELVPEVVGEGFADAGQNREEVGFEGSDGTLGKVVAMNVWRHELVGSFPIICDGTNELCASFIVMDMVTHSVPMCLKTGHEMHVGWNACLSLRVWKGSTRMALESQ